MADGVWEEIRRSEEEADQILESAKRKSSEILRQAREEAVAYAKKTEDAAIAAGERLIHDVSQRSDAWKKEQMTRIEAQIREMVSKGEQKLAGAVDMIIEKVVS